MYANWQLCYCYFPKMRHHLAIVHNECDKREEKKKHTQKCLSWTTIVFVVIGRRFTTFGQENRVTLWLNGKRTINLYIYWIVIWSHWITCLNNKTSSTIQNHINKHTTTKCRLRCVAYMQIQIQIQIGILFKCSPKRYNVVTIVSNDKWFSVRNHIKCQFLLIHHFAKPFHFHVYIHGIC